MNDAGPDLGMHDLLCHANAYTLKNTADSRILQAVSWILQADFWIFQAVSWIL